jgi:lipoprotein-anchoring transpeptidase ErfK/SrfK
MQIRALPLAAALVACLTAHAELRTQNVELRVPELSLFSSEFAALSSAQANARPGRGKRPSKPAPARLPCGDIVSFAVLLDRQGFSPGQIDGIAGANFRRALAAMRSSKQIAAAGPADCDSWKALGGDTGDPAIASYTITETDVAGPFEPHIPKDLPEQAKLTALSYRSPLEALAERFHASPALVEKLNPGVQFTPGTAIKIPGVQPFDAGVKPPPNDLKPTDISIEVSRDESALRATRADGSLVFFAPVTTGSEHDPLPIGDWHVNGVRWDPPFHYNPTLFWDAKARDTRAVIKPGPNNPVGVVWIDLNIDHYGLHGTPEPGSVGATQSHGCVRLTNWDAARVAVLVRPGTAVKFR